MHNFIQKFHSGWAYVALALLVFAIINSFLGNSSNREFTAKDRKIALFGLIGTHIQFLVGIILYFVSPMGLSGFNMKEAALRLTSMEHPLINLIAIVCVTIGWSKHKKMETSHDKFKKIAILYSIGLILILSRIPWSSWLS
ncbi:MULTISPECIES: hypothetical protein [Flavobacterium]|uniref:50S ribosomal protein L27 n=2 Tax=Flavobacterium TaxID=237 RepID=A0AA94F1F7_9FLAO|nr:MULTISPECIES: hypothetical protein [Flavobacterium]OXA77812.1 hypothetical protein B0A56_09285 [Flavobacterium columnare NBRC 100251 = ATCC 23463]AMA48188.1 hypothetical protein AWN65_01255 [Flavobacterium covae]AND63675.1 hypothetical protein AX766_04245 [Flavobacterium covae]MCH4830102.1 hypothetical protein [Flavobacterium columnare]MCH4832518.1 hypothetical protein [Flavobacterium columnare]